MTKLQAPAVFSAREAIKKALHMKSYMEEKIAGAQLQVQKNAVARQQRVEDEKKHKEEQTAKEQKINQKVAKDNKEKATDSLAGLLKKSI